MKKWKTIIKRIICIVLIASVTFTREELEVFAEEFNTEDIIEETLNLDVDEEEHIEVNSSEALTIVSEIVDSRDEYSKEFLLSDGSRAVVVYAQPVHYVSDSGELVEIDNSLVETEEGYVNADNYYDILFKNTEDSKGQVVFEADDYEINFEYVDGDSTKDDEKNADLKVEKQDEEESLEAVSAYGHVINSSSVTYEGYTDGAKLLYEPLSDGVKENIIVERPEIGNTFSFKLKLGGLSARINPANEVELYDKESEEVKYIFPAPYMEDADGAYSEAVWYSFEDKLQKDESDDAKKVEKVVSVTEEDEESEAASDEDKDDVDEDVSRSEDLEEVDEESEEITEETETIVNHSNITESKKTVEEETEEDTAESAETDEEELTANNSESEETEKTEELEDSKDKKEVDDEKEPESNSKTEESESEYVVNEDNDCIYLTITADEEWMSTASFPVIIDPIIKPVVQMKNVDTCCVTNTDALFSEQLMAGKSKTTGAIYRSFVRFNLPDIKPNKIISSAELNVTSSRIENGGAEGCDYFVVRKITSDWHVKNREDKTITSWETQPTADVRNLDYIKSDQKFFNITKTVREWYEGISPNYGLAIMSYDEGRVGRAKVALSTDKKVPYLKITYRDMVGIEDYWGTHNTAVGTAGEGYINDYTGALTVVNNDVTTNGQRKNLNIQHVYNSNIGDGGKWSLNYEETITVPIDELDVTAYPYVYTDGDGTRHYFKAKNVTYLQNGAAATATKSDVYPSACDEDGLKLFIVQVKDKNLKDKYPIKLIDKSGSNVKYFDTTGHLALITDSNQYENGGSVDKKNPSVANRVEVSYEELGSAYSKTTYDVALDAANALLAFTKKKDFVEADYTSKRSNYQKLTNALDALSTDQYAKTQYKVAKGVFDAQKAYNGIEDIDLIKNDALGTAMNSIIKGITAAKTAIGDKEVKDKRICKVTDAVGRAAVIKYDAAGNIVKISDPTTKNGLNNYKYDAAGRLTEIIYSNGRTAKYGYSDLGHLVTMEDDSGYEVVYTYSGNHVVKVQEWTKTAQGQTYSIEYGANNTNVFRFSGIDDIYGNEDDVINTYVFDSQGRNISEYSNVVDGHEVLGATAYTYADNIGKNVARTTYSDQDGGSAVNYIANPSFEDGLGKWAIPRGLENNVGSTSAVFYLGARSATFNPGGYVASINQKVYLSQGTYVLSYRALNESGNTAGADVEQNGESKGVISYSQKDGDWVFEYGSFSVDTDREVTIHIGAIGSATTYMDSIVLEPGTTPSGYVSSTSSGERNPANSDDSNTRHKIKDYAVKGRQTDNYLTNHDFEYDDTAWTAYTDNNVAVKDRVNKSGKTNPYIGKYCSVFTMKNLKSNGAGVKQTVPNLAVGKYTLSGYVKALDIKDTKVWFKVKDNKGNEYNSEVINEANIKSIDEGWRRLTVTFELKDPGSIEIAGVVSGGENAAGTVSLDSLQLEPGDIANQYNILEDGNFNLTTSQCPYKWECYTKGTFKDEIISDGVDGGKCYHISGEPGRNKFLKFTTNLGTSTAESYVLSGWIKTNTTPVRKGRELKVRAYHADDNSLFESTLGIDDYSEGWKYFTLLMPKHKWGETSFWIQFYDNIGDLYIDGLQLSRNEVCTNQYETNGTKKATNVGKKEVQQTYDTYNRLKTVKSPSGTKQTMTYDGSNHVTQVYSDCGSNKTVMKYDKYGNQTAMEVRSVPADNNEATYVLYSKNSYTEDGNYLKSTTGNNGAIAYYTYDADKGLKKSETLPAKGGEKTAKITYAYDKNDHISSVKRTLGTQSREVKYSYGGFSDVTGIEHNGFKYEYSYDEFGNVLSTSIAGQVTQTNVYNPYNGALKETHFADKSVQYTNYDEYGNVTEVKAAVGGKTYTTDSYKYYNDGNVAVHKDEQNNISTEYDYNCTNDVVRNRVKGSVALDAKKKVNVGSETQVTYNTAGNVEEATYIINGKEQNYKYTYEKDGKENVVTFPAGSSKSNKYDRLRRDKSCTYTPVKGADGGRKQNVVYTYAAGEEAKNSTTNLVSRYLNKIGNSVKSAYDYTYDGAGNITGIIESSKALSAKELAAAKNTRTYTYNAFGEIEKAVETYSDGTTKTYEYKYNAGGNITLETVTENDGKPKKYEYSYDEKWKDKLVSFDKKPITYDSMGHPTKYLGNELSWNAINGTLTSLKGGGKTINYTYLSDGKRLSKEISGYNKTIFIYNGDKLLAEETKTDRINYYYDSEGTVVEIGYQKKDAGKLTDEKRYFFGKNAQGDITEVYKCADSKLVGTYEYDLWGKLISSKVADGVTDEDNILKRNPLRYRGYYYDTETGFYYLNSRYYMPELRRFISADSQIAGVSEDVNGYNLFAYCNNNPVNCQDQSGEWPQLTNTQKVVVGLGVITVLAVATVVTGGASCVLMGALYGACTGAATGAASGAVISGGIEYLKTRDLEATKQAAIDGAADGFMWGAIGGAVTGGMNSPHCFVAGTLVCTIDGEIPIEDIQVGDYVLAENPDTGEIDYKPVLETYEHDTYDVVYLTIDGEDFTTTEGHPFYTLERGFVKAGELRYSDTLVDANGAKLHLDEKSKAHLENPVTVYNFAVEDYHTYFVGENDVLVHNNCGVNPENGFSSFSMFKRVFGKAGEGKEWHHIVEQSQIGKSGFAKEMIHNPDNMIALDKSIHRKITAYYNSTKAGFTAPGQSVRDWLAGQSYEFQYEFGMDILRKLGAL